MREDFFIQRGMGSVEKSNDESWYPEEQITELERMVQRQRKNEGFLDYVERERKVSKIRKVETGIAEMSKYEVTLNAFLRRYGLEGVARKIGERIYAIQTDAASKKMLDKLPNDFVYVGGAARAVLERSLGIDAYAMPRDIDIAIMRREGADQDLLDEMSRRYMPEDYFHGHGVKRETEEYFDTRDFTVNQVFATQEAIYCTKQCLLDTLRGVIRFTEYEKKESYHGNPYYVHPKLLAKALRLAVVRNMKIVDEDAYEFQQIDAFHMALHVERAIEQGVAQEYIQQLQQRGQIPESVQTVEDIIEYLGNETDFVFRCVSHDHEADERRWLEDECPWGDIEKTYQDLPMREGMKHGRHKRFDGGDLFLMHEVRLFKCCFEYL